MNNEKRITMLREGKIPQVLLKMGLPTMIGMLITGIYNLVDAYFVGGLGTSQMGAVSITFPLGQAIVGLAVLFGGGAASYLSRLLGAEQREKANQVASTALYSSLLVAAVVIGVILIFINPVLYALGATKTIFPYAKEYSLIYLAGSIFNIYNVTMNNIASSEGATKVSMSAMILGAVLNVIFDPIFIYVFDMGIKGAAIATALAQAITTFMYLIYVLKKQSVFSFSPRVIHIDKETYKEIFKVGIPTLAFQLATSIAISFTNMQAKNYGDAAIAAMGIITRIVSMGIYAVSGFAKGFMPIAGYNYGAKQYDRLQEATKTALRWTTIFCVVLAIILICVPKPVITLFSSDVEVIEIGVFALRVNIIPFAFMGLEAVYSMLSLALGKVAGGWLLSIGRQGVFFIPTILLLPKAIGLNGIIFAQPIADMLTVICMLVLATNINRKIYILEKEGGSISR